MTKKGSRKVEITNGDNEPYENKIEHLLPRMSLEMFMQICVLFFKRKQFM